MSIQLILKCVSVAIVAVASFIAGAQVDTTALNLRFSGTLAGWRPSYPPPSSSSKLRTNQNSGQYNDFPGSYGSGNVTLLENPVYTYVYDHVFSSTLGKPNSEIAVLNLTPCVPPVYSSLSSTHVKQPEAVNEDAPLAPKLRTSEFFAFLSTLSRYLNGFSSRIGLGFYAVWLWFAVLFAGIFVAREVEIVLRPTGSDKSIADEPKKTNKQRSKARKNQPEELKIALRASVVKSKSQTVDFFTVMKSKLSYQRILKEIVNARKRKDFAQSQRIQALEHSNESLCEQISDMEGASKGSESTNAARIEDLEYANETLVDEKGQTAVNHTEEIDSRDHEIADLRHQIQVLEIDKLQADYKRDESDSSGLLKTQREHIESLLENRKLETSMYQKNNGSQANKIANLNDDLQSALETNATLDEKLLSQGAALESLISDKESVHAKNVNISQEIVSKTTLLESLTEDNQVLRNENTNLNQELVSKDRVLVDLSSDHRFLREQLKSETSLTVSLSSRNQHLEAEIAVLKEPTEREKAVEDKEKYWYQQMDELIQDQEKWDVTKESVVRQWLNGQESDLRQKQKELDCKNETLRQKEAEQEAILIQKANMKGQKEITAISQTGKLSTVTQPIRAPQLLPAKPPPAENSSRPVQARSVPEKHRLPNRPMVKIPLPSDTHGTPLPKPNPVLYPSSLSSVQNSLCNDQSPVQARQSVPLAPHKPQIENVENTLAASQGQLQAPVVLAPAPIALPRPPQPPTPSRISPHALRLTPAGSFARFEAQKAAEKAQQAANLGQEKGSMDGKGGCSVLKQ